MARILVAGAGVGGLAAALALAAGGHQVSVLERRGSFAELGAGIQLGPNAFRALSELGVGHQVQRRAVFIDELRLMDGVTGQRVLGVALSGDYRRRFGNPYAVVHRGELYQALLEACRSRPDVQLCGGRQVVGYEQHEQRERTFSTAGTVSAASTVSGTGTAGAVTAVTADGERITGAALVGADGLRSAVRAQLVGDGSPRISGHTIYRSVVPMDAVPLPLRSNTVSLWAGPGWHFVHYPIAGGSQLNLAATRDDGAAVERAGDPVDRAVVLSQFPEASSSVGALLDLGRDWRTWVLCDRDPVQNWVDGRVTLLGDAAHPMLQYAAQGACMALEDAVVLGRLLAACRDEDIPQRLQQYNAGRVRRTTRVQLVARQMGRRLYHASGPASRARNTVLSALTQDDAHRHLAWLHGAQRFDEAA